MSSSAQLVHGKTVAITGGTGSFGQIMARHLLEQGAERVNVLSRDEAKQDVMRRVFSDERIRFYLGDVRDAQSLAAPFGRVDFVFHAAALKQVPSCEFFPGQAVKTNVVGSQNVIDVAAASGVQTLVMLSTDKAVYPVNAMGMSKALMEKSAQAFARNHPDSDTTVAVTRYGNVMYSRGSVIPLFIEQLKAREPLTLTEPKMTRFLMSLGESVELVTHAFAHAGQGDLFVKKAHSATVETLALAVGRLFTGGDVELRTIGSRHGEKLHETLLTREEITKAEDQGEFFRVPIDDRGLQYEKYFSEGDSDVSHHIDYTSDSTTMLDVDQTVELLKTIPEVQAELEAVS